MPTDWTPFFDAINNVTNQWGQRNQYNNLLNQLGSSPPAPATTSAKLDNGQTINATMDLGSNAVPQMDPRKAQMMQMLRGLPPQQGMSVALPLLLKDLFKDNKYSTTPSVGINPQTNKRGQFVMDEQGNQKWLDSAPETKTEFVNGQSVDPYSTPAGTIIPKQEATPDVIQVAKTLYPNDPVQQNAYIQKNSPANLRSITNINTPHQNWQLLTDPKAGTQYRLDLNSGHAYTLDGKPYTPTGASKIGGGAARSPGMMYMQKYMDEHPGASADEINKQAKNFRMGQSEAGTVGTRSGAADVSALEVSAFAKQAVAASQNLPRTQYEAMNSVLQSWDMKTSNPQLRRLMIAADALVNARARAISPTGSPHVNDQLEGRKMLSAAFASGDFEAAVDQMQMEADGVLSSTRASKDAVLDGGHGAPPPSTNPAPAQTKTIGGQTYVQRDGKWYHQ